MAHWHGFAKLRMHTDTTLDILSEDTAVLGQKLREFKEKTCAAFQTRELAREGEARKRRQQKNVAGAGPNSAAPGDARRPKAFNLNTYKLHSLGDYVSTIRLFGTTDSYSTQLPETEHRKSKSRFLRTNGRLIRKQLTKIETRQRNIRKMREKLSPQEALHPPDMEDVPSDPRMQYNMGKSENSPVNVPSFLQKHAGDPAIKDFLPKLKDHLLPRIQEIISQEATFGSNSTSVPGPVVGYEHPRDSVFLKNDRIYHHSLIRFNYTTYDVRPHHSVVNAGTEQCNIMLLADSSDPAGSGRFLYARVLGTYHAKVVYMGSGMRDYEPRRMDFLWVRWYEVLDGSSSQLPSLRFPSMCDAYSFGFVNPSDVLRSCHVIPDFAGASAMMMVLVLPAAPRMPRTGVATTWAVFLIATFMRHHWD
ncbi:hypothetical protein A0H81_00427 [Grifola frondosa]|uniref:Uncharacterized protein n=1 Tax=Grifola frondosa TaxID=5627 RepID=A0A1C7MUF3_GRIFR|nr:hypothetical protein A0H81_00427 [Grifola frondosa]